MNLLEMVLNEKNGALVKQLAGNFGLSEGDTQNAVRKMMPALSRGVRRNMADGDGLASLMKALQKGGHERYLDRPDDLGREETVNDGNNILGHILGSKDVSRRVAGSAAQETGLDAGILKRMLPLLATVAMGAMRKKTGSSGLGALAGGGDSSGLANTLTSFLDADRDGSALDDILGMARKLF